MAKRKLRPINETRRPDGSFTSETAARLLRRRGGLTTARKRKAAGYLKAHMQMMAYKAAVVRMARSKIKAPCSVCRSFSQRVLRYLDDMERMKGQVDEARKAAS